jgi:hypothetical protein
MARPATPVSAAIEPWSATKANGESTVGDRPAVDNLLGTRPTRGETSQPSNAVQSDEAAAVRQSGPFTAQRLAQETERSSDLGPLRTVAMAAYLKARDSHIHILRSIQTIDVRV